MERRYNILLAIPYMNDNPKGISDVKQAFEDLGLFVGRIDARGSKALVKQYLKQNQDTDVLILTQYPGNSGAPYTPAEIDELSVMVNGLTVIPVIEDQADQTYLRELENRGIYTALFAKDSEFSKISKLVTEGRTKKQAREYYGILNQGGREREIPGHGGMSASMRKAFDTVVSYDGTAMNLNARMNAVSEQLSSSEIRELLSYLPPDVFEMVRQIDRFRILCDIVNEEGLLNPMAIDASEEFERMRRGSARKRQEAVFKEEKNDDGRAVLIGVYSTDIGIGCTYQTILFANALKSKRTTVAVVEIDNEDEHLQNLCAQMYPEKDSSYEKEFKLNGVSYIQNTELEIVIRDRLLQFRYIFFDMGFAPTDILSKYYGKFDKNIVITSGADWHFGNLHQFLQEISLVDKERRFLYFVPLAGKDSLRNVRSMVRGCCVEAVGMEENPFRPSGKCVKLARKYLMNRKNPPLKRESGEKGISLSKRAGRRGTERLFGYERLAVAGTVSFLAGVMITGVVAMRTVDEEARNAVQQQEQLKMEYGKLAEELSGIYDRVPAETKVMVLTRDLMKGERIKEEDLEEQNLLLELPGAVIFSGTAEGSISEGDYKKGTVLLEGMLEIPQATGETAAEEEGKYVEKKEADP